MKKLKLTKIITMTLAVISIVALNPMGASAEWRQDSNGWWYSEGSNWATGVRVIDGKKYFFDKDGYVNTGWKKKGGDWYYYNDYGFKKTGWIEDRGKKYFLDTDAGFMYTNYAIDDWYLNNEGVGTKSEKIGDYNIDKSTGIIIKYSGKDTSANIPRELGGIEVKGIFGKLFDEYGKLTSITIPDSVTYIYGAKFFGSSNLKNINVDENNKKYSSVDGVLFNKSGTKLIAYPYKKELEEYIIPAKVTLIESGAFLDCVNITSIKIPTGILNMGKDTFRNCSASKYYVGDEETKKHLISSGVSVSKIILDPKIAEMTPVDKNDPTLKFSNVSISENNEWIRSKNAKVTGNKFVGFNSAYLEDVFPTNLYAVTDSAQSKFDFIEKEELDRKHDKTYAYQVFVGTMGVQNIAFIDKNFSMSQLDKNNGIKIKGYMREFSEGVNNDIHINVGGHIYHINAESHFYCNIE